MSEWLEIELGIVVSVQSGYAFSSRHFSTDGVPAIRMSDLDNGRLNVSNSEKLPCSFLNHFGQFSLCEGDLLVGMSGSLDNYAIIRSNDLPALLNQRVGRFVLKDPETFEYPYLYYLIRTHSYKTHIQRFAAGAAQKNISSKQIERFVFKIPDNLEQRIIVNVLLSLDQAIEYTEALITKYQQIKAGMMHDLFTRGVDAQGRLRPPREQAPELYKQSPVGWIPKDWDCRPCAGLCAKISVGIVIQPAQYYTAHGVPAFRSANVKEWGLISDDLVRISSYANQLNSKSILKAGDIISVRSGYPGTSAVVTEEYDGANCIDLLISRPIETVSSDYLCFWINSSFGKDQVLRGQGGLAQQHFNVGELRKLKVALPGPCEQNSIVERLHSISALIAKEQELCSKLNAEKAGLMHDLLTGRVRVRVAETDKEEAAA